MRLYSNKATKKNIEKAKKVSKKLYSKPEETDETKILTKIPLELGDQKMKMYEAILLALASFKAPPLTFTPVLKGGTIATQYSNKQQNIQNINIQILPSRRSVTAFSRFKGITANDYYWAKQYRKDMRYVISLQVFMTKVLNRLKGLRKGVAKILKEEIEQVAFKIRAKHITQEKLISLLAIDLHIVTKSGKKKKVPVFDIVLGDARKPHKFNSLDVVKVSDKGKVLYQYTWDWISNDFKSVIAKKNEKSVEKAPKRMSRWLNGLVRTQGQRLKNSRKLINLLSKYKTIPSKIYTWGELKKHIMTYSDSLGTETMLSRLAIGRI